MPIEQYEILRLGHLELLARQVVEGFITGLHKSPFYLSKHNGGVLPQTDRFTDTLVRLPLFYELAEHQQEIIDVINEV